MCFENTLFSIAVWTDKFTHTSKFSVNLSVIQLLKETFKSQV